MCVSSRADRLPKARCEPRAQRLHHARLLAASSSTGAGTGPASEDWAGSGPVISFSRVAERQMIALLRRRDLRAVMRNGVVQRWRVHGCGAACAGSIGGVAARAQARPAGTACAGPTMDSLSPSALRCLAMDAGLPGDWLAGFDPAGRR